MSVYRQGDAQKRKEEERQPEKKKDFLDEVGAEFEKFGKSLTKMFTSKEKQWQKKGEGHSLGTAADAAAAAERRQMAPDAAGNQAANAAASRSQPPRRPPSAAGPSAAAEAAAARAAGASAPRKPAAQASGSTPRAPEPRAPKYSCGGTVGGAPSGPSDGDVKLLVEMGFEAQAARGALVATGNDVEAAVEMLSSGEAPLPAQQQSSGQASVSEGAVAGAAEAVRVVEATSVPGSGDGLRRAMEAALEQLVLAGGSVAVPLLLKLLSNIAEKPDEPKFRKIRLSNPKIAASVCDISPAALRLLALCGFESAGDDESVQMPDAAASDAPRLAEAVVLLQAWAELPPGALPPPALGPTDFCVILNSEGGMGGLASNLPDNFYELTGAEAKALVAAAAARKSEDETLRTKAQREAEAARRKRRYRKALVRVRFPDGVMVQATFSVKAPVSLLLQWVSECLREPGHAFELSLPRSKPLDQMEISLEQAELAPAALLNFRLADVEQFNPPYITPHLLSQGQTLSDATQAYPQGWGGEQPAVPTSPARDNSEPRPPPRWLQQ